MNTREHADKVSLSREEKEQTGQTMQAVQGTGIVCFLAVIAGDLYLLRYALAGQVNGMPMSALILEAFSWILLAAGIVWLWRHKKGWGGIRGRAIVFALFGIYLFWSVWYYPEFQMAYMAVLPDSAAVAGAMVGVRVFLVLIGITAGIPTGPKIDGHEYARRLREKVIEQDAQWAAASVKAARKDLQSTVDRLKNTLSPEELQALLSELQPADERESEPGDSSLTDKMPGVSAESITESQEDYPGIRAEDLKNGWGGGI